MVDSKTLFTFASTLILKTMGRELKRVPMDFKWPQGQVWKGYLNPYHSQECKACGGTGLNPETKKLSDDWYSFDKQEWIYLDDGSGRRYNNCAWHNHLTEVEVKALIDEDRLWDFTRVPLNDEHKAIIKEKIANGGNSWLPFDNGYIPTPEEVNNWNHYGGGHDAINRSICVETRAKHLGVYGLCEYCEGTGEIWQSKEIETLSENWKSFEPPVGDGYQLWETTSEGSPSSPVFATLDELCEWCEDNATTFGSFKATKEEWKKMLDDDHVVHQEGNVLFI